MLLQTYNTNPSVVSTVVNAMAREENHVVLIIHIYNLNFFYFLTLQFSFLYLNAIPITLQIFIFIQITTGIILFLLNLYINFVILSGNLFIFLILDSTIKGKLLLVSTDWVFVKI